MTSVLSIYGNNSEEKHGWLASKVIHKVKSKGRLYMAKKAFKYISEFLTIVKMDSYEQAFYAKSFALPIPQEKLSQLEPSQFQSYWDSGYISFLEKDEAKEILKSHGTKDLFSKKERKAFIKSIEYGAGNSLAVCINSIYKNLSDNSYFEKSDEEEEQEEQEEAAEGVKPEESTELKNDVVANLETKESKTEESNTEESAPKLEKLKKPQEKELLNEKINSSDTFFFNILTLYYMSQVYHANKSNEAMKDYAEALKENVVITPETNVYDFKGNQVSLKELGKYRSHSSEYNMLPLAEEGTPTGYKINGVLRKPEELWKYITVEQSSL
ncbi:uncharacterized protein SAPINGB_P001192 [Magnusiomyces paraingens]|uniref:Uncharacterized protein n=1 Tax=Magnusiomyces paraingens TaxID=2606893 RepID=A0A5E8B520_9ASCO|nr:uncharacterized protein SAPINGB_P001192 [Saprochaete ingens]VVT46395.1 unnamed protein product [Saprochaete ingens]